MRRSIAEMGTPEAWAGGPSAASQSRPSAHFVGDRSSYLAVTQASQNKEVSEWCKATGPHHLCRGSRSAQRGDGAAPSAASG